jgi:peptidoglycan/LPS O-acetylase OafA/YrhL
MGAAVTIMLVKERQLAEAFLRAGATSASSAVYPGDIAVDLASIGGRRLIGGAIIREADEGRYYLDLPAWEALRRRRRRVLMVILLLIALFALFLAGQFPPGARP